jgi:hypothetical protein
MIQLRATLFNPVTGSRSDKQADCDSFVKAGLQLKAWHDEVLSYRREGAPVSLTVNIEMPVPDHLLTDGETARG